MASSTVVETYSDGEQWDDCDRPISSPSIDLKPSVRQIHQFTSVDGFRSGLVKSLAVTRSGQRSAEDLNIIIIQSPISDQKMVPYESSDGETLPLSFLLAAKNQLSYENVLSAQHRVNYALPLFFYGAQMFPAILLGTSGLRRSLHSVTLNMTTAVIRGFRRHAVRGHSYPAAFRSANPEDSIVGMLAFSIPEEAQRSLDAFQGGTSNPCVVKASFELKDGRMCSIDCRMYVSTEPVNKLLVPRGQGEWQVGDLMRDKWHLRNLAPWKVQEDDMRDALSKQ